MKECRFFLQGRCMKGESCLFYHDGKKAMITSIQNSSATSANARPALAPEAPSFIPKKPWHADETQREVMFTPNIPSEPTGVPEFVPITTAQTPADSRLTIPCIFQLRGNCRNGDSCPYAHSIGVEEDDSAHETSNSEEQEDDKVEHDNFTRQFSGTLVKFEDGATVSKITLPADFSMARLIGLSLDSTRKSISALLQDFEFEVSPECIRLFKPIEAATASADVKVEDPLFAKSFCSKFNSNGNQTHPGLQALVVPPSTSLSGPASRRVSCRKTRVSWHKPTRSVWLNFGNQEVAKRVAEKFKNGTYKIQGQVVDTSLPKYSHAGGRFNRNHVAWTVVLKDVPTEATKINIEESIRTGYDRPRHIELSKLGGIQAHNLKYTTTLVESLFTDLGATGFDLNPNSQGKRFKALARFDDEADAREAQRELHDKRQESLNGGKLTVQLISSAKFKIPTSIYDTLKAQLSTQSVQWRERHLQFKVYRNTDMLQRFTILKIEGEEAKSVANATNSLEEILAGVTVKDDEGPVWSSTLAGNGVHRKLKQLQEEHGVIVIRNRAKRRLLFFGSPNKYQQIQQAIIELVKAESTKSYLIPLDSIALSKVCKGGFKRVTDALGDNVAFLDIVSNPKRIIVTGSEKQYQTAIAILKGEEMDNIVNPATSSGDCTVCWSEAESPIITQCNHIYCLDCFENLCTSAGSTDGAFQTRCQGEMGKCAQLFSLRELQDHLSSTAFEDILEASHASYIRRHPQSFRYCPTPDCGYIYRTTSTGKTYSCPKCLELTCTACHAQHGTNMTCADYKEFSSGGYAAFEEYKREHGVKDCPKCSTPIEKTYGCNHMTCEGCGIHICWFCLRTFPSGNACYDHMDAAHGGISI